VHGGFECRGYIAFYTFSFDLTIQNTFGMEFKYLKEKNCFGMVHLCHRYLMFAQNGSSAKRPEEQGQQTLVQQAALLSV